MNYLGTHCAALPRHAYYRAKIRTSGQRHTWPHLKPARGRRGHGDCATRPVICNRGTTLTLPPIFGFMTFMFRLTKPVRDQPSSDSSTVISSSIIMPTDVATTDTVSRSSPHHSKTVEDTHHNLLLSRHPRPACLPTSRHDPISDSVEMPCESSVE